MTRAPIAAVIPAATGGLDARLRGHDETAVIPAQAGIQRLRLPVGRRH